MRPSSFHVTLAVLGSVTGVLSRVIPSSSLPPSQLSASYPSTSVSHDSSKHFFSQSTDHWSNSIYSHDKIAPVVDIHDDTKAHSNNLHQHESRANADWNAFVEKGNRLYANLENAVRTKHAIKDRHDEWKQTWTATKATPKNEKPEDKFPSEVGGAMDSDGIPSRIAEQYERWHVKSKDNKAEYIGFFHSDYPRAIVEMKVEKNGDIAIPISEVSFQTAWWAMTDCDDELRRLEYIYKPEIKNPVTQSIMRQAYARSCEKGDRIVFTPNTEEFKALLATPNGAIAPRMLTDHADFFERTVMEIRLYLDKNMMVFKLG